MPKRKSDVTILREHLKQRHVEVYGIDYVSNNYAMEGRNLKTMIAQYGVDVVRQFIDACFADYRPTRDYPGLNFAFMFSYQRARILPRVLADEKRRHLAESHEEQTSSTNLTEWW
ncbi:hypothetical protein [Bacillus sp. 03113]|uniref:hypothetical protein n=1 Tax=Bacillus sp. 03113 TaxID=2578211 RepID=UPI001143AFF4|nr:hypothetical protein [Bacillus sp. 03113]